MHIPARKRLCTFSLCLTSLVVAACGSRVPSDSNCRNLVYKEDGLSRSEYLPCAREIVGALDELARLSDLASRGDRDARSEGQAMLRRVHALMHAAGGRNLLERWDDRALTDLNMRISNAVNHFEAFYMVRVLDEPDQFAAQTRQAAETELRGATRNSAEALRHYRRLE